MFEIIKPGTNFDFAGRRNIWLGVSGLLFVATVVLFFTKGVNYGIDFTGGAKVQVSVPTTWDTAKLRKTLEDHSLKGSVIQEIGVPQPGATRQEFLIRAKGDSESLNEISGQIQEALSSGMAATDFEIQSVDVVGPAAGDILRKNGFLAMFYALLVILVYVGVRFDSRYAPGAIIALFHDSMIVMGIFILTQKQFDLTILAALLALMGYSNNDTIIVYDRVRETSHMYPGWTIEKIVNHAVNETLGRTIVTSLTTFLVVFSLWMFGGKMIENFAFALMIGVVVGTYSSVFIASSVIIILTQRQAKKALKLKTQGTGQKKKKKAYEVRPEPKIT